MKNLKDGTLSSIKLWNGENFAKSKDDAKEIEILRIDSKSNYMHGCSVERIYFTNELYEALKQELSETANNLTVTGTVTVETYIKLTVIRNGITRDITVTADGWRESGKTYTIGTEFQYTHTDVKLVKYTEKIQYYKSRYYVTGNGIAVDGVPRGNRSDNSHSYRQDVEVYDEKVLLEKRIQDESLPASEITLKWEQPSDITIASPEQKELLKSILKTKETVVFENNDGFIEVGLQYEDGSLDTIEFNENEIFNEYSEDSFDKIIPNQFGESLIFSKEQREFLNKIAG